MAPQALLFSVPSFQLAPGATWVCEQAIPALTRAPIGSDKKQELIWGQPHILTFPSTLRPLLREGLWLLSQPSPRNVKWEGNNLHVWPGLTQGRTSELSGKVFGLQTGKLTLSVVM